jgi:crossover junction endodeoxyribonuclease RuvC
MAKPQQRPDKTDQPLRFSRSTCLIEVMRILGIDPGIERVGFGVIERNAQHQYYAQDWGVITTSKHETHAVRLQGIYKAMTELIDYVKPEMAAIEQLFFFKNAKTIIPVAQARGVIILTFQNAGLQYSEFTPMQVKMNMAGYGKSDKKEIQAMTQTLLNMDEIPKPDDAADALAIALSCAFEQDPRNALVCR